MKRAALLKREFDVRNNSDEVLALKLLVMHMEFTGPGGRCVMCGMQDVDSRGRDAGGHSITCPVRLLVYAPSCEVARTLRARSAAECRAAMAPTRKKARRV